MNITHLITEVVKHLPGQHDQRKHGHPTYMTKRPGEHDFGGVILDDADLQLMRYANKNEEYVGNQLNYTPQTVQQLLTTTYNKLGLKSPGGSGQLRPALATIAVKAGLIDLNALPEKPEVVAQPLTNEEKQLVTYTIAGVPSKWLAPKDIRNPSVWGSSRQNKIYNRWGIDSLSDLALYAFKYGQLDVDDLLKEISEIHPIKFNPNAIQKVDTAVISNLAHRARRNYPLTQDIDVGDTSLKEVETQILGNLHSASEELPEDLNTTTAGARALLAPIYQKLGLQDNVVNTGRNRAVVWAVENNLLNLDNLPENPLAANNPPDEWERWALNGLAIGHTGKELAPDTIEDPRQKVLWSSARIAALKKNWGLRGISSTPEVLAYAMKYSYITLDSIHRRAAAEGLA